MNTSDYLYLAVATYQLLSNNFPQGLDVNPKVAENIFLFGKNWPKKVQIIEQKEAKSKMAIENQSML